MYKEGYIVPSGLLEASSKERISAFNRKFQNTPIRMGCIVNVIEVDDEVNNSKGSDTSAVVQYDVVTDELREASGSNFVKYINCIALDGLGGVGDFFEYKMRTSTDKKFEETHSFQKQNGTMVLLLCIDGFAEKPIIIGGVKHQNRKTTLTKDAGLHLEGEYNGLNWQIDKEGSLTIKFKSKTDNDGKPQDEKAGGSFMQIDQKGSLNFDTGLEDKEETYVRIDKEKKDVGLKAGQHVGITAQQNIGMTADGKIQGKAKGAIEFLAEGTAKYTAKSSLDIEGKSKVGINSDTVMITGNNMVQIEGQKTMINSPKVHLGQGGTPAVIATTKFVGTGNHGAPVTCSAVGPFSSAVFIAS